MAGAGSVVVLGRCRSLYSRGRRLQTGRTRIRAKAQHGDPIAPRAGRRYCVVPLWYQQQAFRHTLPSRSTGATRTQRPSRLRPPPHSPPLRHFGQMLADSVSSSACQAGPSLALVFRRFAFEDTVGLECRDDPMDDLQHRGEQLGMGSEQDATGSEMTPPLPHRHPGDDVIDRVGGGFCHSRAPQAGQNPRRLQLKATNSLLMGTVGATQP
jgi:hypothetical protein